VLFDKDGKVLWKYQGQGDTVATEGPGLKTLAVPLDAILDRLEKLEVQVRTLVTSQTVEAQETFRLEPSTAKNGEGRVVSLSPELVELLKPKRIGSRFWNSNLGGPCRGCSRTCAASTRGSAFRTSERPGKRPAGRRSSRAWKARSKPSVRSNCRPALSKACSAAPGESISGPRAKITHCGYRESSD
jgi:hypothetical protein